MGIRFGLARAVSAVSTAGLKHVFRRPAANFPGKIALYIDPALIADLRDRMRVGSICVVGTNGKTTVTNLLADAFEAAGHRVVCNRTGANLDSGVATALLHTRGADWGVFECDELWLAKILPNLRADYVLLLNLFRDQLDRVGEIDHIQESIVGALAQSPETRLVYNADDPLCQAIADRAGNEAIPFGIADDLGLPQNTVADARMCQRCDSLLEYEWRQYGQLGNYRCPTCGFTRVDPAYSACEVAFDDEGGARFTVARAGLPGEAKRVRTGLSGAYMIYNLLAVCAAADLAQVPFDAVERAIREFDPKNGRLQSYRIDERDVLLNLAKNPTGFNQNLKIVLQGAGPKAVAFFINDKEADGRDVSWLWDIDFQELAAVDDLVVYAGGIRRNDMQVRLKYAGVEAELVNGAADFLGRVAKASPEAKAYVIANYTALPGVKGELDQLQNSSVPAAGSGSSAQKPTLSDGDNGMRGFRATPRSGGGNCGDPGSSGRAEHALSGERLVIAHMFPTLLNLYGDGGNVTVLAKRASWRGIDVEIVCVDQGDSIDFSAVDIVFLGGGPDREQHLASMDLAAMANDLRAYVEDDGVLLAICGGFQIMGRAWLLGDESVPGLGIARLTTERAEGGSHNRLVGNIALTSPLASRPVVGYENHAGRTQLDAGTEPFGRVTGSHGAGNNEADKADGVLYRNLVGTYLHGPLLAKNPEVADTLIERALARRATKEGRAAPALPALDDAVELAANRYLCDRLL